MLDPFGPAPQWLQEYAEPLAKYLPSFPLHAHEVLFFFTFYQVVQSVISPKLSAWLFPNIYPHFPRRTKLNWDVHVVSLVQSVVICAAALWVMFADGERKSMTAGERVYGYSGACGLIQAMATGYFLYDLIVSTVNIEIFGIGLWFHAVSALWVFSLGFRPFVNFYSPVFILYELSSPFLNFHWFFDKVNMTGSKPQWYNGMLLLSVFFGCRLVWGTWQSVLVFKDIFGAYSQSYSSPGTLEPFNIHTMIFQDRNSSHCVNEICKQANAQVSQFAQHNASGTPAWLGFTYLGSNLILNSLNFFWFSKMIETVTKRFRKDKLEITPMNMEKEAEAIVLEAAATLEEEESVFINGGMKEDSNEKNADTTSFVKSENQTPRSRRRKA